MPYIGNTIRAADDYRLIDDISSGFNGSATSFALQVAGSSPVPFPKSPQQILVSVNGVIQEPDPTGASGFNLVGTNIVFSSAPTNGHAFFGIIYATADYLNAGGEFPAGSVGAPSFTFIGDQDTGIYRKGSGSIGFVSNATEIANTDSNGITISSGNLILGDSSGSSDDRIKLGASGDLELYHNGSDSFIVDQGTGVLVIQGSQTKIRNEQGHTQINASNDVVELYYDNSKKFETRSNGIEVLGHALLGDNYRLGLGNVGSNGDLQIYHDGTDSIIDNNTGNLNLVCDSAQAINLKHGSENMIRAITDGAVELYYDNSKKLETVSDGAHMTRELRVAGTSVNDFESGRVRLTEGGEQMLGGYIHYDGAANLLHLGTHPQSDSTVGNDVDAITMNRTSGSNDVKLLYNGSTKLSTISGGVQIHGNLAIQDGYQLRLGNDNDAQFYHSGSNCILSNSNGLFYLGNYSNTNLIFQTNNTNRWAIWNTGHFIPDANNTVDIGSSSTRVRNIYTNDLNLSNEGSKNDVDGTWGDYTIQEGESDLFLINKRSGKKFKFMLQEVS